MTNVLAPPGWTNFVLANPAERGRDGETPPVTWTPDFARLFGEVNDQVNEDIAACEADVDKPWRVWPPDGCCHDFACTKRSVFMQDDGIPSSCLLLAEVQIPDAEYHLVLVVRTTNGQITLDNLTPALLTWPPPGYNLVKMQSAANPDLWEKV